MSRPVRCSAFLVSVITLANLFLAVFGFAAAPTNPSEWEKTIAAAKQEGRVVVLGPAGTDLRDAFTQEFQTKFPEIQVDYNGMSTPQIAPKLITELSAGVHHTDLVVSGTTTAIGSLIPANAVVPIQTFLVGPEGRNASKWRGGKFDFSDNTEKYNLVYGNRVQIAFVYNRDNLQPSKIRSWKDFLHPEWKGKIAMREPRRAGAGLGWATFWYASEHLGLGKNYVRQLFSAQEIFIVSDERQLLDVVARGRYPVAIGPSGTQAFELKNKGLPIEFFGSAALLEGGVVSASNNALMVPRNAPRSNALKVYLDYLLSREGQHTLSKASGLASLRLDVPHDHIPDILVPKEGVKYLANYKETFTLIMTEQTAPFMETILSR
jgi:ABC-type Fe3+ transport system substrate-binding protein